jgi:hypothetical protein
VSWPFGQLGGGGFGKHLGMWCGVDVGGKFDGGYVEWTYVHSTKVT